MNAMLTRCRHVQVNWLDSHSCRCVDCGKTGHWFELQRLVMWTRCQKIEKMPLLPTLAQLQDRLSSHPAVSS